MTGITMLKRIKKARSSTTGDAHASPRRPPSRFIPFPLECIFQNDRSDRVDSGGTDDDGSGIVIIPFPLAPPGFLVPPAGVGNPKKKDSCPEDYTETKCKDCKAQSGWCTEGPQMGCPCLDECPTGKDLPVCSDEGCVGGEDDKCSVVSCLVFYREGVGV